MRLNAVTYGPIFLLIVCVPSSLNGQNAVFDYPPSYTTNSQTQLQAVRSPLEGQIEVDGISEVSRLSIALLDLVNRHLVAQTQVNLTGSFSLSSLPVGTYELQVRNQHGDVLESTTVTVPTSTQLQIKLANRGTARPGGVISQHKLTHKIPKQAAKSFRQAISWLEKKDRPAAKMELAKALEKDPEFALAYSLLGAIHLEEAQPELAREQLGKALSIDPEENSAKTNLALALLQLHRTGEAEAAARACLRANAANARARFYLALSLLEQGKPQKEAIFHLTQAKDSFPPAQALLESLKNQ